MSSTLLAPDRTVVDAIPLGKRISEIMNEKGKAFTQNAMARRLGINRETMRRMLKGDRPIYTFELEPICNALHLSLDRVLQDDIKQTYQEFRYSLSEKNHSSALKLAKIMVSLSVGLTEKCRSMNDLGRAYYYLEEYENAHECWLSAYSFANDGIQGGGRCEPMLNIVANLMISYSYRKEYSNLKTIISEVRPYFDHNPQRSALICYSLAKIAEDNTDSDEANKHYYDALHFYSMTQNSEYIAKAHHFVGCFEYRQGNYKKAIEFFSKALPVLATDQRAKLISVKEYSKTLLKLGDNRKAEELITQAISEIRTSNSEKLDDLLHQFTLLLGVCLDDPKLIEQVLLMDGVLSGLKLIVAEYLVDYYEKIGDSASVLKYYRTVRQIKQNPNILDRDGV